MGREHETGIFAQRIALDHNIHDYMGVQHHLLGEVPRQMGAC